MKDTEELKDYLIKSDTLFQLQIDDMKVNIEYSENNITFNDCIINILRHKIKQR